MRDQVLFGVSQSTVYFVDWTDQSADAASKYQKPSIINAISGRRPLFNAKQPCERYTNQQFTPDVDESKHQASAVRDAVDLPGFRDFVNNAPRQSEPVASEAKNESRMLIGKICCDWGCKMAGPFFEISRRQRPVEQTSRGRPLRCF